MPAIIPSILEEGIDAFKAKSVAIEKIPQVTDIQADFSDGIFTPHKTVLPGDLDVLNPAFSWEAHLMVQNPKTFFFDCCLAGFKKIIFHFESVPSGEIKSACATVRDLRMSCALAVLPETPLEEIFPFVENFDGVLLLSVQPGYQGGQFLEETYGRLEKLKSHLKNIKKDVKIEIDGGIKPKNAGKLLEHGADFLVIGSGLFEKGEDGSVEPEKNFEKFQRALRAPQEQK